VNGLLRKTDAGGNQQRTPAMVFDAACGKSTPLLKSCCERTEPPATFLGFDDPKGRQIALYQPEGRFVGAGWRPARAFSLLLRTVELSEERLFVL